MRLPYQLSKIGKEKRKSGAFRLCGLKCRASDSGDVIQFERLQRAGPTASPWEDVLPASSLAPATAEENCQRYRTETRSRRPLADLTSGAIKKLPQVGQEPVEAVESGHINPDGPMIIDY